MKHQGTQNRALADDALYRNVLGGTIVGAVQHTVVDVPLSGFAAPTIQGATSGVPFPISGVLPANFRLLAAEINLLIEDISGGNIASATVEVNADADTPLDTIIGSTDVFTGAALGFSSTPGTDPYQSRAGQTLQATITTGGDTPDHATTGHFEVHYYYVVEP